MPRISRLPIVPIFIVLVLAMTLYWGYTTFTKESRDNSINSFKECVDAGNPVMESYPAQCNANGRTFVDTDSLTR